MARISLRAYHREIEDLIEDHQYDQAISHCRYILKYYPKNINSYRLLGKAYLESQRYADASDIFQRVLSSVPDDFVSHVGNSIIREDEGNLDEAIWHMERAFESQPANAAIQSELRRLHGRREGMEPPKIRLTRAALARMYLKGELFQQAIAELRAGLNEDPKRHDLQVLLAQAYLASGQRADAAEICSKILKTLPFCLDANRILAEILSHSERADEAKIYASRVQSMDPYAAHLSSAAPTPDKVPDTAVLLERQDWRPGTPITDKPSQPEWATTVGVDLGGPAPAADAVPDWLTAPVDRQDSPKTEAPLPTELGPQPTEPAIPSADVPIPDWMKDAGWIQSSGVAEENAPISLEEGGPEATELERGNIPDWLQSIKPVEPPAPLPGPTPEEKGVAPQDEEPIPVSPVPWLEETPPGPSDSVVTWLESKEGHPGEETPFDLGASEEEEVPDWLKDLEPGQAAPAAEELETLVSDDTTLVSSTDLEQAEIELAIPEGTAEKTEESPQLTGESAPEGELVPEAAQAEGVPDWLAGLSPLETAKDSLESSEHTELEGIASPTEIPDWIAELKAVGDTEAAQEADVAAEVPAEQSPSASDTEAVPAEAIPDWLQELEPEPDDTQPNKNLTAPTIPEHPVELSELPATAEDATRVEEVPEWLQGLDGGMEEETAPPADIVDAVSETPSEPAEKQELPSSEALPESTPSTESNEWMAEAIGPEPPLQVASEPEAAGESLDDDEAFAWLENLAVKQGADEALLLKPEDRRETPPEWVQKEAEAGAEPALPETQAEMPAAETITPELSQEWISEEEALPQPEASMLPSQPEAPVAEPESLEPAAEAMLPTPSEAAAPSIETGELPSSEPATVAEYEDLGLAAAAPEAPTPLAGKPEEETQATGVRPESEMLFWPREISSATESVIKVPEPLTVEEGPVLEEDTKPAKVKEFEEAVTGREAEAAVVSQAPETQTPMEAGMTMPEAPLSIEEQPVVSEISEAEPLAEAPAQDILPEELPEWLRGVEEEPSAFPADSGEILPFEAEISTPEETAGQEDEVAFAWLEGLADRQGIEESMPFSSEEPTETLPDWVVQAEEPGEEGTPLEETLESEGELELPSWLQEVPAETPAEAPEPEGQEEIPAWLKQPATFEETSIPAVSEPAPLAPELPSWLADVENTDEEEETPAWMPPEEVTTPQESPSQDAPHIEPTLPTIEDTEQPRDETQLALLQARNALVQGSIPTALEHYQILVHRSQMLPEVIQDLNEALYRFPVDVDIWQLLGDAQARSGHLQDALDAYTKAEEYLH